ncbi:MAG: hypothetical protein CSA55_03120 [Ilumatobacter coccineus]|uniref:N-acetyltransferase domain-containing protein n=1 Tax=Ilumatobacter coccineus TaxID=467094 RepID=A0A2G6KBC5_9ACTN|nr:MAG: hypothetical protein CSA55_03120 [Ilumatobacter coccineus]
MMARSSWFRRTPPLTLYGRRVALRPLGVDDFRAYREVRRRNADWLLPWEPLRSPTLPDPTTDRSAFEHRCSIRHRDIQLDHAYAFGLFVGDRFAGEVNLTQVIRGATQSGTIGYWIDRDLAGHAYVAEGVAVLMAYAFDALNLHRLEICIVPRNHRSRRVVDKLGLRNEGTAQSFLEINGVREDHVRYAITSTEWAERRDDLIDRWIGGSTSA